MMIRLPKPRLLAPLLLLAALAACDRDSRTDGDGADDGAHTRPARWERDLVFLPGYEGTDAAAGAIFLDFHTLTQPDSAHHVVRGWRGDETGDWMQLVDERWSAPPSRDPWRILPQGPLRLTVGLEDEIETLSIEADSQVLQIQPGPFMGEWSPSGGARIAVREADLSATGETSAGWLIDARFGPAETGGARAATRAASSGASAETIATNAELRGPAPAPEPQWLGGVLVGAQDRILVIGAGSGGALLWMWSPAGDAVYGPVAQSAEADGTITLAAPGMDDSTDRMQGRLSVEGRSGSGAGALMSVQGSFTVDGSTFPVAGLLREPE